MFTTLARNKVLHLQPHMGQGFTSQGPSAEMWKMVIQQQEQHVTSWLAPHTVVLTVLELPFTVSYGQAANAMSLPTRPPPCRFSSLTQFSSNKAACIYPYRLMGPYPLFTLYSNLSQICILRQPSKHPYTGLP